MSRMADLDAAVTRIREYLAEFDRLKGVDQETVHIANWTPLLTADMRMLLDAVEGGQVDGQ